MNCCPIIIFIIIIIASLSSSTKKTRSGGDNENINLDDIFKDVMNASKSNASLNSSDTTSSLPLVTPQNQPSRRRNNRAENSAKSSRTSMTTPTSHGSHNCEEVNYDKLGSLEGGTGSFNLSEPEPTSVVTERPQVKIGREDLLKSFIMSEVLQRYDINRIYSRIPPIKSDD